MRVYYTVNTDVFEDDFYIEAHSSDLEYYLDLIAKDCAEDYYGEHDGWESKWPLTFRLYTMESGSTQRIGTFNIELEMEPQFFVSEQ